MNRVIIYISALLFITSCGASKEVKQKKELEKLALEIMEVHDRSMPNHGKLFGLKKKLTAIQECYSDTLIKNDVMLILWDIQTADNDMMEWMHTYTAPDDFLPFEEKKTYYLHQKQLIEEVERLMNQAIDKSQKTIEKYPIKKECPGF